MQPGQSWWRTFFALTSVDAVSAAIYLWVKRRHFQARVDEPSAVRGLITVLDRPGLEERSCECYAVVKSETARLLPQPAAR